MMIILLNIAVKAPSNTHTTYSVQVLFTKVLKLDVKVLTYFENRNNQ